MTAATFFTNDAMYSDIVLPVNTEWEREGGFLTGNRESLIFYSKVVDSLFESKEDQWIASEIGVRLGIDREKMYPISRKQQVFNQAAGALAARETGVKHGNAEGGSTLIPEKKGEAEDYEPLCTITEEDIRRWGVQGEPQKGRIPLSELEKSGIYQVRRFKGDAYGYVAFQEFREDPDRFPRPYSESGRFEIFSRRLSDRIREMGYGEIRPIPAYIPPYQGYEDTFSDWEKKEKGEYPFQIVSMHYLKRAHTTLDNVSWLNEIFTAPVLLNRADAEALEISDGDPVQIRSRNGGMVRIASVTERIMRGCAGIFHGGWTDWEEEGFLDAGSGENLLFGSGAVGQGTSGFNSLTVKIEKYEGDYYVPDAEKHFREVLWEKK